MYETDSVLVSGTLGHVDDRRDLRTAALCMQATSELWPLPLLALRSLKVDTHWSPADGSESKPGYGAVSSPDLRLNDRSVSRELTYSTSLSSPFADS